MLSVLANRTYRHLFLAQLIALVGTGLATVALGLLAYDIAGGDAGAVLGTALAIKMIAYIGVAPIAGAFADRVPRKALLVALDLVRVDVPARQLGDVVVGGLDGGCSFVREPARREPAAVASAGTSLSGDAGVRFDSDVRLAMHHERECGVQLTRGVAKGRGESYLDDSSRDAP